MSQSYHPMSSNHGIPFTFVVWFTSFKDDSNTDKQVISLFYFIKKGKYGTDSLMELSPS
jgi:hypothetical protein